MVYKDSKWIPLNNNAKLNTEGSGIEINLYDLNKNIMSQLKPLSDEKLKELKKLILTFDDTIDNTYYMLLCREQNYYTMFVKNGCIGINAITIKSNGNFRYNAKQEISPPKNNEPVSPIITFAGFKLNIKNPKILPTAILPNIATSPTPLSIAITVKHVIIIAHTLDDKPFTPSVKFTAFVVASITKIANGIYKNVGKTISFFIIGINISVPCPVK